MRAWRFSGQYSGQSQGLYARVGDVQLPGTVSHDFGRYEAKLTAAEREAIELLLTPGDWTIFGAHGAPLKITV